MGVGSVGDEVFLRRLTFVQGGLVRGLRMCGVVGLLEKVVGFASVGSFGFGRI